MAFLSARQVLVLALSVMPFTANTVTVAGFLINLLPVLAQKMNSDPYSPFAVCSIINFCTVQCCLTETQPEQIHLALGTDETQVCSLRCCSLTMPSTVVFFLVLCPDEVNNGLVVPFAYAALACTATLCR